MTPSDVLVWLQTTVRRNSERTIASIERSDIGAKFIVVTDKKEREFPKDYADLQCWWDVSWRDMASCARIRGQKWLLRLEDDILVNRHILHNLCRWRAPQSPQFALGTFFYPDYWLRRPELFERDPATGCQYRNLPDVEGAQAQLISVDLIENLLDLVPSARRDRGIYQDHHQPSFDWSLSRSAWKLKKRVFVHEPSLVNIHQGSLHSQIDLNQHRTKQPQESYKHYWGHQTFKEEWRAA